MLAPLTRLHIPLEAVAQVVEELCDPCMTDPMAEGLQGHRQRAYALARPPQRRLRIAGRRRLHQRIQIPEQRRVDRGSALPAAAGFADPSRSVGWKDRTAQASKARIIPQRIHRGIQLDRI